MPDINGAPLPQKSSEHIHFFVRREGENPAIEKPDRKSEGPNRQFNNVRHKWVRMSVLGTRGSTLEDAEGQTRDRTGGRTQTRVRDEEAAAIGGDTGFHCNPSPGVESRF